jgi:hypothetical protein
VALIAGAEAVARMRHGAPNRRRQHEEVTIARLWSRFSEVAVENPFQVLTEFEHGAADAVTALGGRVVKLIGDDEDVELCRLAIEG